MLVHEFIDGNKPVMVLIHGVLTPWQIWTPQIEAFRRKYNIYAVALNGHTEEEASEFVSVKAEAESVIEYLMSKEIKTVDALCGISLGGKIAHEIWKSGKLDIMNLVMDGAPLVSCPRFAVNIMINNYKNIVKKSKVRDKKVIENFKKYFLPEKYLDSYLRIADLMSKKTIENMVSSVFAGGDIAGIENKSRVLFIHGTKGNEVLSKKSAKLMKKYCSETETVCFRGDAHCHKAIYEPEKWIEVVEEFLRV